MDTPAEAPLVQAGGDITVDLEGMNALHEIMEAYWRAVEQNDRYQPDDHWRALFSSAIAEIAGNIVRHAYPPSERGETFHIQIKGFADRMEAILLDHGVPYDYTPPSRSADMRDALDFPDLDHGWGLPIAHAATDLLDYQRLDGGYNRWILSKRLP